MNGGALYRNYTRESTRNDTVKIDFKDSGYPPKLVLYILCGILDAMWQTAAYWMMVCFFSAYALATASAISDVAPRIRTLAFMFIVKNAWFTVL